MRYKFLIVVLLGLLITGCCKVQYAPFISDKFPSKPVDEIIIYHSSCPDRPYTEIGIIEVNAPPAASLSRIINAIKQKASEIGADAVILGIGNDKIRGVVAPTGGIFIPIRRQVLQATAIRFKAM